MPRLRPRGPAPRATVAAGASAVLAMPGLAVPTAVLTAPTLLSATLAMPGLDITARPTIASFVSTTLAMAGLAITATLAPYTYLSATLAMPGLSVSAAASSVRDVAATLAMPGLDVPEAIVSGLTPSAVLAMPGLAVPTATVVNTAPTILAATLAMPGLSVTAALNAGAATFRLAPDYTLDWAKQTSHVQPSVGQIGSPVSNGVRMYGGPGPDELVGNVALWSKNKSGPGWTAAFTLKKTDSYIPPGGGGAAFLNFYFGSVGDGQVVLPPGAYYVSPTGSDSNNGSLAAPFATLAHGLLGAGPGDIFVLRAGTYRQAPLTIGVSGAAGNPITIMAYPGEAPVFTACLAAYETPGNTAWEVDPSAPAGVNSYRTVATLATDDYSVTLQYNGVSYGLNRYANLAWLRTTNYVYSTNPLSYYRGPGFFFNPADGRLYIRLDSLTGARAVDLDQGNSAIPPGFDFNIPPNPDPRLYRLDVSKKIDVVTFTGSNVVWDGVEVRGGDRSFAGTGSFLTVKNAVVVGHRVGANLSGGAHDWVFTQLPRMDSGFFSPWAAWAEIKDTKEASLDQKRSICTESGTNFNIEFTQCRFGRYYDGFTAEGHHLYLNNCDAEFIEDDGMQCGTDAYDVQFCRNYWRGPILTDNGSTPQTISLGSKYVVGNLIANIRDEAGYQPEFFCRLSHPSLPTQVTWRHSHSTVVSHTDPNNLGVNPKRYAQNTFIYRININNHGCGIQREQRGAGVQESYNNIVLVRDRTKAIDGGDTRDGGEIRDGNVYWRQGAPTLEPLFTKLASTSVPSGTSYQTLVAWRASAAFTESGWEALSKEADPLLVDLANHDFRLQAGSPAASGFLDISGRGWPFVEPGTHAGAVAPGATDPLGNVGATFFRSPTGDVPPTAAPAVAFPTDIAQWPSTTDAGTTTYRDHTTGARIAFFFQSNGSPGETVVPTVAVFKADGSVYNIAAVGSPAGLSQLKNFPYAYTISLSTASPPVLTLTQVDASGPTTRTITWTDPLLAQFASPSQGSFGLLCTPGRTVEITSLLITPPGGGTPPSATLVMPGLGVSAQVDSTVTGTDWPNGYANRRTFVVPPQDDLAAATLGDFILQFDTAKLPAQDWTWLATEFLSVVGGVPYDLRLETPSGSKIEHWVRLYTASPPRLVWRMRVPNPGLVVGPSGATFPFCMFSGKAGLAATEELVTGVFAGVLAARTWPGGRDISGKGRHLTSVVGVTAGTVDGLPGGVFGSGAVDGSYARSDNPTWLDGNRALTEEITLLLSGNAGGNLWRAGGTPLQLPPLNHNARASTFMFGPTDPIPVSMQVGWNPADDVGHNQAGQNNSAVAAANSAVVGETHLWHFVRSSGADCHIYKDEAELATTFAGTLAKSVGSILTVAGDVEGYGAGTGAQNTAVIGTYGLALLWPKVLGPSWVAVSARSQLTPRALLGVGVPDLASDATTSPVAVPLRRTIVGQTDLDVAALAFDDQSPRTAALVSVTDTDPNCSFSAVGGKVRAIPAFGTSLAPAVADYVVGKGAKRSTARLYLTVSGVVTPPTGYYKIPNHLTKGKTPHNVASIAALNTLQATIGSDTTWAATNYINITADFLTNTTVGSPIIITVGGTRADPLVITCTNGDKNNNWTGRPIIYNSPLVLRKPWVWCFGLRHQILPTANHQWRVTGSYPPTCYIFEAPNCFVTACRANASQFFYHDQGNANADGLTINYNWHEIASQAIGAGEATVGLLADWFYRGAQGGGSTIHNLTMMYNTATDSADALGQSHNLRFVIIGNGTEGVTIPSTGTEIGWNYVDASVSHMFEFKNIPDYCHHNHLTGRGSPTAGFNIRGPSADGPTSGARPLFLANRFTAQLNQIDDGYVDYVSNWLVGAGGAVAGEWHLYAHATRTGKSIPGADGCKFVDNRALFIIGANDFEPAAYTYGNLGSRADVFFQRGNQTLDTQLLLKDNAGAFCRFSGDPGTMIGSHPNVVESAIHYQSAVSGFTPEVPPVLNATVTGPGASGLTWT